MYEVSGISHAALVQYTCVSLPNGQGQSVGCVACTFTFDLGCGHFGIRTTIELRRFCVLSLRREVVGV